ncbi:MAG: regulatory protein RecX [Gaiellaceae bacterium]
MPRRPEPALDVALRALRAADRSRAELDERLARKGYGDEERRGALDELERLGYLDDERTASLRAARLAERGYGDAYIRADLERRGLDSEAALAGLEPESERAERQSGRGEAWLARRGFAPEG